MITFRKFQSLRPGTRVRKLIKLLREAQVILVDFPQQTLDWMVWEPFFREAWTLARDTGTFLDHPPARIKDGQIAGELLRRADAWRHQLLSDLGLSTADWDFSLSPRDGEGRTVQRFPIGLYLEDLRSPFNVGSLFRSAEAFGASRLILSPQTPGPEHLRVQRTAMGTEQFLDWSRGGLESLDPGQPIFALEMGGTPLEEFEFPSQGICLIGTEELGLSPEALKRADQGAGRVTIPLFGRKSSLNVAVAAGILLAAWTQALDHRS